MPSKQRNPNLPPNQYKFFCIKKKTPLEQLPNRKIRVGHQDTDLCDNTISTAKYNAFNFLPKNLLYQFSKLANDYFLIVGLLQIIPEISTSNGIPYIFLPLTFIIAVSAIKDLAEDLKRHFADRDENNKITNVFKNGKFQETKWRSVRVGDIVMVKENEFFPADIMLLYSDGPKGVCYIETKNLDGETNLKHKFVKRELLGVFDGSNNINVALSKETVLNYERPNVFLYQFNGNIVLPEDEVPLSDGNFCLRGCSLRNTKTVYGVVAYTGHDTKIMLNSIKARPKLSTLERIMNKQIVYVFAVQILFCVFSGFWAAGWYSVKQEELDFLNIDTEGAKDHSFVYNLFVRFGNWLLIFTNFVPISLLVTLEVVKLFQGMILSSDSDLVATNNHDIKPNVQSSNLLEELGQVEYVFSDKTGTLTQNFMEFKNLSVRKVAYGGQRGMKDAHERPKVTNVDFLDQRLIDDLENPSSAHHHEVMEAMLLLAVCHSVIVDEKDGKLTYNASSPDELALINFAKFIGFEFKGLNENEEMMIQYKQKVYRYQLIHTLEFTSKRKRMSVIVKDLQQDITVLYTKGADSILYARMNPKEKEHPDLQTTNQHLGDYGKIGLRTLVLGKKTLDEVKFQKWNGLYKEQLGSTAADKEKKMEDLQDELETELDLVGATAIEDKLQIDVGITISKLKEAGIRVWVLTGDKVETAINIAYSCKLLSDDLTQLFVTGEHKSVKEELIDHEETVKGLTIETANYALIVSGDALHEIQKDPSLPAKFMKAANVCKAVIACRVSPAQKQEIVMFVRNENPKIVTLAIGDGANDVNMITAAHVGIGIRGVEGQQAARASDFAVGEFRFLHRLLFVYGRESYRKNSHLILYNFFKNMVLVLPQFWYAFLNGFSGQVIYEQFIFQFFNIFFASVPIMIYAVFDKEIKYQELMREAEYYTPGPKNQLFNTKRFWFWFFSGCWQAVIVVFFSYFTLASASSDEESGRSFGFWSVGMMAFSAVVLVTNLKVLIFSNTLHFLNLFFIFGSILVYILIFFLIASMRNIEIYGDFKRLFSSVNFYLGILLVVVATNGIDVATTRWDALISSQDFQKKIAQRQRDNEELKPLKIHSDTDSEEIRTLKKRHTGFAFSGEEKDEALMNAQMGNSHGRIH